MGLEKQAFLSHGSGGWKSKIKSEPGRIYSEASRLDLQAAATSLHAHMASSFDVLMGKESGRREGPNLS